MHANLLGYSVFTSSRVFPKTPVQEKQCNKSGQVSWAQMHSSSSLVVAEDIQIGFHIEGLLLCTLPSRVVD